MFVLLHSPVLGPSAWRPVARELERRGEEALVPSLAGPDWRHAVAAVHDAAGEGIDPVVLAAHSGAGPPLPAVAGEVGARVAGLVFVDASVPAISGGTPLLPPELLKRLRPLAVGGRLSRWPDWFGEDAFREAVPDAAVREELEREMPRLPLSYFEATVPAPDGWDSALCAYILFSSEAYGEEAAEARRRGWQVEEIPGGHLHMLVEPRAVADALLRAGER